MNTALSTSIKFTIALLIGPAVLYLSYLAIMAFVMSIGTSAVCFASEASGCFKLVPHFLWGLAGILGVIGFWISVFSDPKLSRKSTILLISLLACGLAAAARFLFAGLPSLFSYLDVLALLGGLLLSGVLYKANLRAC